jgi:hypothetical protein
MVIAADSSPPTGPSLAADWVAAGIAAVSETSVTAAANVASAPVAVIAAADSIITREIRCAGVEEVAAIALMQRALLPRHAIAKLLALPGGGGVVGDGGLRRQPRPEGVAREEDREQVHQGKEAAGPAGAERRSCDAPLPSWTGGGGGRRKWASRRVPRFPTRTRTTISRYGEATRCSTHGVLPLAYPCTDRIKYCSSLLRWIFPARNATQGNRPQP